MSTSSASNTEYDYSFEDSADTKFKKLNVNGELKLSVLCGLVEVSGSASYLKEERKSNKTQIVTLILKVRTHDDRIENENTLPDIISRKTVKTPKAATHFVSQVHWGANVFVTLVYEVDDMDNEVIKANNDYLIESFKKIGVQQDAYELDQNLYKNLKIKLNSDIIIEKIPSNLQELFDVLRTIPDKVNY